MVKLLESNIKLGEVLPNVTALLRKNSSRFADRIVFQQKELDNKYHGITWKDFYENIENIAYWLKVKGFQPGDKLVLFSRNSLEMLQLQLAVKCSGGIAVPIFANFKQETADLLITHSRSTWLAIQGDSQFEQLGEHPQLKGCISFDKISQDHLGRFQLLETFLTPRPEGISALDETLTPDTICLNMYTSGTMGTPKCVQLTHGNIMSQQAALDILWDLDENDRFLAYLPWHHSFGGIFELYTALYNGATYSLESSYGRDVKSIFENWRLIKPTLFFSVPKVYQSLYEMTRSSKEAEKTFFDSGLKFIFTAAAALPERLSNEFERRNISVIEGWGLTETSPCCTLTDPHVKRHSGVVGFPIPGVQIRIAEDEEIQVKGPNVMLGYFDNEEANKDAFTSDGWYRTGDVGEITAHGLKLISRKDRIFKLSNGEKVIPSDLEKAIELKCHYVQYVVVSGSGEEHPVALIFPNKRLLENPDYETTPEAGCFCPRSLDELGKCLKGCLHVANESIGQKFSKIKSAAVILHELSLDDKTLTPSMKVAPKNVLERYRKHLQNLYGDQVPVDEEVYVVELEPAKKLKNV